MVGVECRRKLYDCVLGGRLVGRLLQIEVGVVLSLPLFRLSLEQGSPSASAPLLGGTGSPGATSLVLQRLDQLSSLLLKLGDTEPIGSGAGPHFTPPQTDECSDCFPGDYIEIDIYTSNILQLYIYFDKPTNNHRHIIARNMTSL